MDKILTQKNTEETDYIKSTDSSKISSMFLNLSKGDLDEMENVYKELGSVLGESGFIMGNIDEVGKIINNQNLICRSENFTKVLDLISESETIDIKKFSNDANMCYMYSGKGFRVAMQEGFSGADVGNIVKVVITFEPNHLTEKSKIDKESNLWDSKRETAEVSLSGSGEIKKEDIKMISFRVPRKFFPENLLTDEEAEDEDVKFIFRNYILK